MTDILRVIEVALECSDLRHKDLALAAAAHKLRVWRSYVKGHQTSIDNCNRTIAWLHREIAALRSLLPTCPECGMPQAAMDLGRSRWAYCQLHAAEISTTSEDIDRE